MTFKTQVERLAFNDQKTTSCTKIEEKEKNMDTDGSV